MWRRLQGCCDSENHVAEGFMLMCFMLNATHNRCKSSTYSFCSIETQICISTNLLCMILSLIACVFYLWNLGLFKNVPECQHETPPYNRARTSKRENLKLITEKGIWLSLSLYRFHLAILFSTDTLAHTHSHIHILQIRWICATN